MGIPHFVRRLKEAGHGTSCELGRSNTTKPHTKAIIDGPGLAYHIYNQQRNPESDVNILIDSAAYQECISKTIEFLENLESYGFDIEAIFFDGGLPSLKADTRIDRLKKSASSLSGFKILHDSAIKATRSPKVDLLWALRSPDLTRARRDLPAPPFLVPSLVEGLLQSRYSNLVYLVPGEADPFCAALGRLLASDTHQFGVTIFTNDSDLIVFDSGAQTKVTMLNDLEEVILEDQRILKGITFCPASITENLKGSGLPDLAWLMLQDSHASVNELSSRLPLETTSDEQEQFKTQYLPATSPSEEETYTKLSRTPTQRLQLANLDARVSEVIQQAENTHKKSPHDQIQSGINIYLPFLLEDPSSASAWEIGADARLAAYTLLQQYSNSSIATFSEYKRSGRTVTTSSIDSTPLMGGEYPQQICTTLASISQSQPTPTSDLTNIETWRVLIAHYLINRLSFLGRPIPQNAEVIALLNQEKLTDWRSVQLSAHFQAAYYSIRMLFQIARYIYPQIESSGLLVESVNQIQSVLKGFPSIAQFFESRGSPANGASGVEQRKDWTLLVEELLKPYRQKEPPSTKRKRKNKSEAKGKATKAHKDAGNPFAALSEE